MSDVTARLKAALEGRYEVEREIGEGGMATVYLARDLRHNRSVALKVLKPELAAVVGAERFLAEIETTANLQHPHILPLFDSGEADGFLFYVMPFVEGETLRERIERERQLPVDEAVGIATSVARALQHAHDRGVIHRDIKPANILMQDGQPVVSDFGIALAVGSAGGTRLTETGLSVGTPYYMSPEQATGDQQLGPASDIYALGSVLYELLTGDPPYVGSTAQAVLGKIIQGAPVSATEVRRSVPPNVDGALRRALEKLPADRFTGGEQFAQAMADSTFRYGDVASRATTSSAGPWKILAGVLAVASVALGAALAQQSTRSEEPRPVARFAMPFVEGQGPILFGPSRFALSPDGSMLAYSGPALGSTGASTELWTRHWPDVDATPVEMTGIQPSISPDGSELAVSRGASLVVLNTSGGPRRTLTSGSWPRWSYDGSIIYFLRGNLPYQIPATGGREEAVRVESGRDDIQAVFVADPLPDGTAALVHAVRAGGAIELWVLDLESGEVDQLGEGGWPRYSDSGHLVFLAANGALIAAPFDPDRREIVGPSVPLLEGVAAFSIARNGDLVYTTLASVDGELLDTELVWVDRQGETSPAFEDGLEFDRGGGNYVWRLSPDDTRLALRRRVAGNSDIWIKDLDGGPLRRLTFDPSEQRVPWWSPDGSTVMYLNGEFGERQVWSRAADGTGSPTPVWEEGTYAEGLWSRDGEWLVLRTAGLAGGSEGDRSIVALRPGIDTELRTLISTPFVEQTPTLSPDARWLAYESHETGRPEVFVQPFPDVDGGKWQVSTNGGIGPIWSNRGGEIFFVQDDQMMAATVETEGSFQVRSVEPLFTLPDRALIGSGTGSYDVTSDDERFVMALQVELGGDDAASTMVLVQNFAEELKARVPRD